MMKTVVYKNIVYASSKLYNENYDLGFHYILSLRLKFSSIAPVTYYWYLLMN